MFNHLENRQQNYNSLTKTFKKLRYLINSNFDGRPNELFLTLTYREQTSDTKKFYTDFDRFFKRLRYRFKERTTIDYLCIVEPHASGNWHCHVLLRFNDLAKIFIKSDEMEAIWGQGFVKLKSLKGVDDIGAYLSAYLADVELTEDTAFKAVEEDRSILTKKVDGQDKKFIKGGRLHMYPSGMNIYRKSRGIVHPEREETIYKELKKEVGSAQPHFAKSYHVQNDDFENTITFEQYNTKR
jgi:hypothetical protein